MELIDLKIHQLIQEGSETLITEDGRLFVLGGVLSKSVMELDEVDSTLQ
jgi:hypothetical protein